MVEESPVRLFCDSRALLGECPRWRADEGALYWLDIDGKKLWRAPENGKTENRPLPQKFGCFVFDPNGGFMLAGEDGFYAMPNFDDTPKKIAPHPDEEAAARGGRFNDGRCDARGDFWCGAVDATKKFADAALWRLAAGKNKAEKMRGGFTTFNGLAFCEKNHCAYFTDTPSRAVLRAEKNSSGEYEMQNTAVFYQFAPDENARPDGACVDAAGNYWCALFEGARVACISPRGKLLLEIALPIRYPTMPCFGGAHNSTLFVTSGRRDDPHPQAGGVWAVEVDARGAAEFNFGGGG